jgi:hypothetical protein
MKTENLSSLIEADVQDSMLTCSLVYFDISNCLCGLIQRNEAAKAMHFSNQFRFCLLTLNRFFKTSGIMQYLRIGIMLFLAAEQIGNCMIDKPPCFPYYQDSYKEVIWVKKKPLKYRE